MDERRQYRPGSRRKNLRKISTGAYTGNRYAWVRTLMGELVLMYYPTPPPDVEVKETGPTARVIFSRPRMRSVTLDLTLMTLEELDAMRDFLNLVDETIRPLITERDRIARDAFDAGDDSYSRSYRQVPQFIVRQRPESTDGEGVLDGHEDVPAGDDDGHGGSAGSEDGVRGAGSELADDEPDEGQPEDDDTQAH